MKERIVIEKELLEKIIKASPIQWFDNKEKTDKLILFGKEYKTEKYPTSYEELKEMCKNLKEEDILVTGDFIDFRDLHFYKSGLVCIPDSEYFSISTDRTPAQMWQIIKNLIGEE